MAIRLTCPSEARLRQLLHDAADDEVTYPEVGVTEASRELPGHRSDRWSRRLVDGESTWQRACDALRGWQVHRGAGLTVCVEGPPAVGRNVAMSAPLPVGHVEVVCRVVGIVDEPDRFGFSYGTLSNHPESGEESFTVTRRSDGMIQFDIVAVSRPRHPLARAFRPIARQLQQSATARYLDAMSRAASGGG